MIKLVTSTVYNRNLVNLPKRDKYNNITPGILPYSDISPCDGLAEWGARLCYKSNENFGSTDTFIDGLMKVGHYDVIEHAAVAIDVQFAMSTNLYYCLFAFQAENPYMKISTQQYEYNHGVVVRFFGNLRVWREIYTTDKKEAYLDLMRHSVLGAADATTKIGSILLAVAPHTFSSVVPYLPNTIDVKDTDSTFNFTDQIETDTGAIVTLLGYTYPVLEQFHACFQIDHVSRAFTHQHVRQRLLGHCLAPETLVYSMGQKKWTIEELYRWKDDVKLKGRLKLIKLRGVNENGILVPVTIKNIIYSGKQKVYCVTTRSGRSIRSTENHRFLTLSGWKPLKDIRTGEFVFSNGLPAYKDVNYLRKRYLEDNTERKILAAELGVADSTLGKWIRKFGLQKPKSKYVNRRGNPNGRKFISDYERKLISQRMTGENNHRWKGDMVGANGGRIRAQKKFIADKCEECGSVVKVERHHIDGNTANNDESNIIVLCAKHHRAWHGVTTKLVFRDEIISIVEDEIVDTYDIEINEDLHNFVANGIVVHNSQESQRYVDINKSGKNYVYPPNLTPDQTMIFDARIADIFSYYDDFRMTGLKKEDARMILPNCITTRIVSSSYIDGWKHYIKLRTAKDAQYEIRQVALAIESLINELGVK